MRSTEGKRDYNFHRCHEEEKTKLQKIVKKQKTT